MLEAVFDVMVAALPPNVTDFAFERFLPVMVTMVPPDALPEVGLNAETRGGATYVYALGNDVDPAAAMRKMDLVPAVPDGARTRTWVSLMTEIDVAETALVALVPNLTDRVPVSCVPVMVTIVPAPSCPEFGETEVMVGVVRAPNVNADGAVTVPESVVTVTSTGVELVTAGVRTVTAVSVRLTMD